GAATDTPNRTEAGWLPAERPGRAGFVVALAAASLAIVALVLCLVQALPHTSGRFLTDFVIPWVSSVALVVAGLALLRLRPAETAAQVVAVLLFAQAVFCAALFDPQAMGSLLSLSILGLSVAAACLVWLALNFPSARQRVVPVAYARVMPWVLGVVL